MIRFNIQPVQQKDVLLSAGSLLCVNNNLLLIGTGSSQLLSLLPDCPLMCLLVYLSTIYSWVVPSSLRPTDDAIQLLTYSRIQGLMGNIVFHNYRSLWYLFLLGAACNFPSTLTQLHNT